MFGGVESSGFEGLGPGVKGFKSLGFRFQGFGLHVKHESSFEADPRIPKPPMQNKMIFSFSKVHTHTWHGSWAQL